MAFNTVTAALVLVTFLNVLLTDCYVLPSNQISNGVIVDSTALDLAQVISDSESLTGQASGMQLPSTNGETPVGHKRSVTADMNGSNQMFGFAIFEGLNGSEVGPFMQAVQSGSQHMTLAGQVGLSLGCTANQTEGTGGNTVSEFTHASPGSCPASLLSTGSKPVNERSLCPWKYVEHTDENRHPKTMTYVQCFCPSCIQPAGQGFSTEGRCRPIVYRVKVLRKASCQNGVQIYESYYEEVPVACTCVRPETSQE